MDRETAGNLPKTKGHAGASKQNMNKKRKQPSYKAASTSTCAAAAVSTKLQAAMKGKRLAVTTRISSTSEQVQVVPESINSQHSYNQLKEMGISAGAQVSSNQLKEMCISAGAQVSSQVHKNVHALIASSEAVESPATQRVRKAWKLNIAVVQIEWIEKCLQEKKLLPMDAFLFREPLEITDTKNTSSLSRASKKRKVQKINSKVTTIAENDLVSVETKNIDLGCCCICHDSVKKGVLTDCKWCVGCSVNSKCMSDSNVAFPNKLGERG